MSRAETRKLKLNSATHLTIVRMLSVPLVAIAIYYGSHGWILILFALAAFTDAIDGFIARVFNQKTWLGALLDPIADKMLLITAFVGLTLSPKAPVTLPVWITIVVVFRDVLILSGAVVIQLTRGNFRAVPTVLSKLTTVCQVATIFEVTLGNYLITRHAYGPSEFMVLTSTLSHLALLLTVASGLQYVYIGTRMLLEHAD
jgi:cardiolipin synthase